MQLESLKMFCDVVETGSFSRAAQLNHVTQSAVSQQIRALENRYEQKLLSRSARQVTPTPAGERLFRGCKEILARFSEVEQEIREQSSEVQGTTTVSTIYSVGLHELQSVQKLLLKTHPKVNMRLNYRRSDQVYDDIILGAAEIGLVADGVWPADDNPLVNAPHTASVVSADEWSHAYPRSVAGFPAGVDRTAKYWPPVRRIDGAYGDRNLVCSCPSPEAFED